MKETSGLCKSDSVAVEYVICLLLSFACVGTP